MSKCDKCGDQEAIIHLVQVVDNHKEEVFLCEDCAREYNATMQHVLLDDVSNIKITKESNVVQSMLEEIQKNMGALFAQPPSTKPTIKQCPTCGITLQEIIKAGRYGCANDYTYFHDELAPVIERLQGGNSQHKGKIPANTISKEQQIKQLEEEMDEAAKAENFERAAQIRDSIRSLNEQA